MFSLAKQSIKLLFKVLLVPIYALYLVISLLSSKDRAFVEINQLLSLLPGKLGIYVRGAFLCLIGVSQNDNLSVGFLTIFSHENTQLGDNIYIGAQCNIGMCAIGKDCMLGSGVHILSGKRQHSFSRMDEPMKAQGGSFQRIEISEDVWIGNQAVVMANIGKGSIVAAGAVVTKDVEEFSIVAGNPATLVSKRTD